MDRDQQDSGTFGHMYGHDCRSGGHCSEQKPQYEKHQSMHRCDYQESMKSGMMF